jgi:hypothetical protein
METELQPGTELGEGIGRALPAACRIAEDPDLMTARDLSVRHVEDVPEQAAERSPEDVQDTERPCPGIRWVAVTQNQRSLMTIVSPGRIG